MSYVYDDAYRLTTLTDANSEDTDFVYDLIGNRLSVTDAEANTTSWVYDNLNRVIEETNELADTRLFEYDAANNLTEKTDRIGRVTQFVYDNLHRLTSELWKDGATTIETIAYTYDVASQLTNAVDSSAEFDYVYDGLGRVTSITVDLAGLTPDVVMTQGYDAAGNRTSVATTIGGTADTTNSYTFDNLNRLTRVTQAGSGGGNAVAQKRADFAYNALSQYSTITRYNDTAGTILIATSTYAYDAANRLTDLDYARSGTALAGYDVDYDEANRITSLGNTQFSAESATITRDNVGRPTAVDRTGTTNDESYTYDSVGNRNTANGQTYTIDPANRIASDGVYDYTYDEEGNRTVKEKISTGEKEEYVYDHRNRLTKITFKNSGGTVIKEIDNKYDLHNRWTRRTIDPDGPGGSAATDQYFISDGQNISLAFGNTAAGDVANRFLWGPGGQFLVDEPIVNTSTAGTNQWGFTNPMGSVADLFIQAGGGVSAIGHDAFDWFGKVTGGSGVSDLISHLGNPTDPDALVSLTPNGAYDPNVDTTLNGSLGSSYLPVPNGPAGQGPQFVQVLAQEQPTVLKMKVLTPASPVAVGNKPSPDGASYMEVQWSLEKGGKPDAKANGWIIQRVSVKEDIFRPCTEKNGVINRRSWLEAWQVVNGKIFQGSAFLPVHNGGNADHFGYKGGGDNSKGEVVIRGFAKFFSTDDLVNLNVNPATQWQISDPMNDPAGGLPWIDLGNGNSPAWWRDAGPGIVTHGYSASWFNCPGGPIRPTTISFPDPR